MTYQETIEFLYSRLPMFSRVGDTAIKKGLGNIETLCSYLGNPHKNFISIHVGGTNGKGSTSHMFASILQCSGKKTGLYTSPHIHDFRERIRINGQMISEQEVIDFVKMIRKHIDEISPSFFEITVAMAFHHFSKHKVEAAIIEVGLGGRLDSTNIINPVLSVITNIGWDHMQLLGDTLPLIAFEKAGIIKENTPVVIGETHPETQKVFLESASAKTAPISFADQQWIVSDWQQEKDYLMMEVAEKNHTTRHHYKLDLQGLYQRKNICTVLESIRQLKLMGWEISELDLKNGFAKARHLTRLHGRWEVMHHDPLIVIDVAHNIDGIKMVREQLESCTYNKLYIVMGMVKDKDVDKVLTEMPIHAFYFFTQANIPRALEASALQEKAKSYGLKGEVHLTPTKALQAAVDRASREDMILVSGSVFLVGDLQFKQIVF